VPSQPAIRATLREPKLGLPHFTETAALSNDVYAAQCARSEPLKRRLTTRPLRQPIRLTGRYWILATMSRTKSTPSSEPSSRHAAPAHRCRIAEARRRSEASRDCEHGLGHLLNPTDAESDDRSWIAQAWLAMVRRSLGLSTSRLAFEPRVAVGQVTVSSPAILKPLRAFNAGKPYREQIKPFNSLLSSHVRPHGHPIGADPTRFLFHPTSPIHDGGRR